MAVPIYQVDAFTDRRFRGNPAAVCLLEGPAPDGWMQDVAREMNLSETAFVYPEGEGFLLRWFTPTVEVDLCGHATLATAHVLWESGRLGGGEEARFQTRSGLLTARRAGEWIEMDFPEDVPVPVLPPEGLLEALDVLPRYVGRGKTDCLVEVESEEAVRQVKPDMGLLASINMRGVIVTARARERDYDFVSRFFGPAVGVPEDPVTGSAHCCLGPYWQGELGKSSLVGYQASARGGTVRVRVGQGRVFLSGQAVTVLRGELG